MFSRAKNALLDLLFPARCAGCHSEGSFLCQNCTAHLQWLPPRCIICGQWTPPGAKTPPGRTCLSCRARSHIYGFLSPFSFSHEPIRQLIHALKYQRTRAVASTLAAMLEEYIKKFGIFFPADTIIIPIPLHKSRERVRGFNQSMLIARHLAQKLEMNMKDDILLRIKKTQPQIELSGAERKENLQNVFMVSPSDATTLHKKTILLVDDVKTTGATLEEAARVLKVAGARRVWAATIAH